MLHCKCEETVNYSTYDLTWLTVDFKVSKAQLLNVRNVDPELAVHGLRKYFRRGPNFLRVLSNLNCKEAQRFTPFRTRWNGFFAFSGWSRSCGNCISLFWLLVDIGRVDNFDGNKKSGSGDQCFEEIILNFFSFRGEFFATLFPDNRLFLRDLSRGRRRWRDVILKNIQDRFV